MCIMFDRFDASSRKTMALSCREAVRLGHKCIDVGHISLALLLQGGAAAWILSKLGANLSSIKDDIEESLPECQASISTLGQLPFTPNAKKALENTFSACTELGHSAITSPHLLLGMLHPATESCIARSLAPLNITYDAVRREIILLAETPSLLREAQAFRPKLTRSLEQLFSEPAWRSLTAWSVFLLFVGGFFSFTGKGLTVLEVFGLPVTFRGIGAAIMTSGLIPAVLAFRLRKNRITSPGQGR